MTKEKAQVGDLIRITCDEDGILGRIYEVVIIDSCCGEYYVKGTFEDGSALFFYAEEFEIYRKAGEEDEIQPNSYIGEAEAEVLIAAPTYTTAKPEINYVESAEDVRRILKKYENPDAVNPQHYKQFRVEVIDIIEDAVQGADPFEAALHANIVKYTLRYRNKNGIEDLRKSIWYTEKLIAHLESKNK